MSLFDFTMAVVVWLIIGVGVDFVACWAANVQDRENELRPIVIYIGWPLLILFVVGYFLNMFGTMMPWRK